MTGRASLPLLAAFAAFGACAPEQPKKTVGCDSVVDCPLGKVCDRALGECIDEPENRFLGAFHCTPQSNTAVDNLQVSEVSGRIGTDHFSLPSAVCLIDPANDSLTVGLQSLLDGTNLEVWVRISDLRNNVAKLGIATDGINSAGLTNFDTDTAFGYSNEGTLSFSATPVEGKALDGYLDVTMYPSVDADALFGAPCPRGLADCGNLTVDGGGVALCANVVNGLMCVSTCSGDGDCIKGKGAACVHDANAAPGDKGLCTMPCQSHADCQAPLRCVQGKAGESNGCF
jgi:hypothetical protein